MSEYMEKAKELRAIVSPHYNCAQAIVIPFAEKAGITPDIAWKMAANFGGGMRRAAACGAITGGLMVLGCLAWTIFPQSLNSTNGLRKTMREPWNAPNFCKKTKKKAWKRRPTATAWFLNP